MAQKVNKYTTTTTASSSLNPSKVGQTVTFKHASTVLGTGALDATGTATFSTNSLAAGSDVITAFYGGSTNFNTSSASQKPDLRPNWKQQGLPKPPGPGSWGIRPYTSGRIEGPYLGGVVSRQ